MATTSKLSLPSLPAFDPSSFSDSGSLSGGDTYNAPPKFPHTRAQLSAIARQNKPPESYDTGDEFSGVTTEFVGKIVGLLDEEHEDELKDLLKGVYGMDDDTVRFSCMSPATFLHNPYSSNRMCWISCINTGTMLQACHSSS